MRPCETSVSGCCCSAVVAVVSSRLSRRTYLHPARRARFTKVRALQCHGQQRRGLVVVVGCYYYLLLVAAPSPRVPEKFHCSWRQRRRAKCPCKWAPGRLSIPNAPHRRRRFHRRPRGTSRRNVNLVRLTLSALQILHIVAIVTYRHLQLLLSNYLLALFFSFAIEDGDVERQDSSCATMGGRVLLNRLQLQVYQYRTCGTYLIQNRCDLLKSLCYGRCKSILF